MRRQAALLLAAFLLAAGAASVAFGLGSDHPSDRPVTLAKVPDGLNELINQPGRVHGFFVNAEDRFFYAGNTENFAAFLAKYATIRGIEAHRLTVHAGKGVAKSPWDKGEGVPCDWTLEVGLKSWRDIAAGGTEKAAPQQTSSAKKADHIAEVHVWTGGAVKIDDVKVPPGIEVVRAAADATKAPSAATTATLEVSIAIPEYGGNRNIEYGLRDPHFHVVVRNVSDKPVNLWTAKYSWGWDNLSFEVKDASGAVRTVKKGQREWDKNFPDACTLQPGDSLVLEVNFSSAEWTGAPKPSGPAPGGKFEKVTMRAVYEIQPSEESKKLNVWTGRAESPWREYSLVP